MQKVPSQQLQDRMARFRSIMDAQNPEWAMATIFSKLNQYYFTGTMQEGMLLIPRDSDAIFWVRRSYDRAKDESQFPIIKPMDGYKDAAAFYNNLPDAVYLETEFVPLAMLQRFQKYFPFT